MRITQTCRHGTGLASIGKSKVIRNSFILLVLTILASISLATGCGKPPHASTDAPLPDEETELTEELIPEELLDDYHIFLTGSYTQCSRDIADTFLKVYVSVPSELKRFPFTIPICKTSNVHISKLGLSRRSFNACGGEGGFSGSLNIVSSTDDKINLDVHLRWSSSRGKGDMDQEISIPFGQPGQISIAPNWTIEWEFHDPENMQESDAPQTTRDG